jgi:hypothetical protein
MFVFHFIYTIVYLVPGYGFRGPTNIADPASPLGGGYGYPVDGRLSYHNVKSQTLDNIGCRIWRVQCTLHN